jgi:formylglycine-generating enzyme required for sulfatase activity
MGSADSDSDADSDEKPQHTVYLDAFWIMQTEVTNAHYARCVQAGDCTSPANSRWNEPKYAEHPVTDVSWHQASAYCQWAGSRLPTEAGWEKAARGTDGRKHPWGNQAVAGNLPNFADRNFGVSWADKSVDDGYQFTAPVGSYPAGASPYGLLDMAGNVWEWVADWYSEGYYADAPVKNPTGPAAGSARVLRGGSWGNDGRFVRSAGRYWYDPDVGVDVVGFRCARSGF